MSVTIKKLTPPQVAAVLSEFPACVAAGYITSTASQVTFNDLDRKEPWRLHHVRRMLHAKFQRGNDTLAPVVRKLDQRPDLVVES